MTAAAQDPIAAAFQETVQELLTDAETRYERAFSSYREFYQWMLDHHSEELEGWEKRRAEEWLLRLKDVPEAADLRDRAEQVIANLTRAAYMMSLDHRPMEDSAFDMPTGGRLHLAVARQLDDPYSPLNQGNPDWELVDASGLDED